MDVAMLIFAFVISFFISYVSTKILIKWQKDKEMLAKDMHKSGSILVPGIGGPAILTGFLFGISFLVGINLIYGSNINFLFILSAILCIAILSYMGLIDDLFQLPSYWKFFLPAIASVPLVAVIIIANQSKMFLPFIGLYDFGIYYAILLVPLAIVVASNFTNMLAGFNGIEVGMGIIAFLSLSIYSLYTGNVNVAFISFPMLASLVAFYLFNKYPSKIFPGDSGTYLIGGAIAATVIIGNMEGFGALLLFPHAIDAIIKLVNGFPKSFAIYAKGKLYNPRGKIRGFADLVLAISKGMSEKDLVKFFIILEMIFSIIAFIIYLKLINFSF